MFIPSFLRSDASNKSARPFHMWARLIPIGFCQFSQHFASVTRATITTWKRNSQWSMQHFAPQLWWKWAAIRKSFRHYTWIIRYQGYLINSFLCYSTVVCDCYPLMYEDKGCLLYHQKGETKSG